MPRFRFTVRRMMVAVAIAAVLLGVWAWVERRRARLSAIANWHHGQIICVFFGFPGPDGEYVYEATDAPQKSGDPPVSLHQQRIDTWHREIAVKYWRAAEYPWLPVAPDSPEPK
jgi:hypothetical protein